MKKLIRIVVMMLTVVMVMSISFSKESKNSTMNTQDSETTVVVPIPEKKADKGKHVDSILLNNELSVTIGESTKALPEPDEVLDGTYGFQWYLYNTDTYNGFVAAAVSKEEVIGFLSVGNGWEWNNISAGDDVSVAEALDTSFAKDYVGGLYSYDEVFGVMMISKEMAADLYGTTATGEAKLLFHLTNAYRVMNGVDALSWNDSVAKVAIAHSMDMLKNVYFSHTDKTGGNSYDRLKRAGIIFTACGENLAYGYNNAVNTLFGWISSPTHRNNLVNPAFSSMGIGAEVSENGMVMWTQNFIG